MNLQERKTVLQSLGAELLEPSSAWQEIKYKAEAANPWFTAEFIDHAATNIARRFLSAEAINHLADKYNIGDETILPKKVGLVMAGNIPMVGFHDLYCTFLSGHFAQIKLSSKDTPLMKFLVDTLVKLDGRCKAFLFITERLNNCDAYIATGSNNTAGYFDYYFGKYPHIIRRNRTSVAVLTGSETAGELEQLATDVFLYFGLGCRNVTKLYVPVGYRFEPLLNAFKNYDYLANFAKYKNNYDYNLAIHLLNKKYFMSTDALLLIEEASVFSPIGQLNYDNYTSDEALNAMLDDMDSLQAIVGKNGTPFGQAQCPAVDSYADGVDTMAFLTGL